MNKSEFVDYISENTELSKRASKEAVDAVFDCLHKALVENESVQIASFGKFICKQRTARKGRNPKTGKELTIPACRQALFQPFTYLKDCMNPSK